MGVRATGKHMSISIIRHKLLIGRLPVISTIARAIWGQYRALRTAQYYIQSQNLTLMTGAEKRERIASWQRISGYEVFVETGTFVGNTTLQMSKLFAQVHTVEVDLALYQAAKERLSSEPGIACHLGNSSDVLPTILAGLKHPAIFWLDAHHSGGFTGYSGKATPIEEELRLIFSHPVKEHIILIDDARIFMGIDSYPTVRQLHNFVSRNSAYQLRMLDDVIRIYPTAFD